MSRRRTKSERELIADMMDSLRIFCNNQENCANCPLRELEMQHEFSCITAYALYLAKGKGDDIK